MRQPFSYYGGKQKMAKHIIPLIPKHDAYIEPFFGGGTIFFQKQPSRVEIINDKNDLIINFFTVLKNEGEWLAKEIEFWPHSETKFYECRDIIKRHIAGEGVEKNELAFAFWYTQSRSFLHQGQSHGFAFGLLRNEAEPRNRSFTEIIDASNRVKSAQIMCRDYFKVIEKFDSHTSFFYIDPPYAGSDQGQYPGWTSADTQRLSDLLKQIKGKFLLSDYPQKEYGWMARKEIKMRRSAGKDKSHIKTECLYYNYEIDRSLL